MPGFAALTSREAGNRLGLHAVLGCGYPARPNTYDTHAAHHGAGILIPVYRRYADTFGPVFGTSASRVPISFLAAAIRR